MPVDDRPRVGGATELVVLRNLDPRHVTRKETGGPEHLAEGDFRALIVLGQEDKASVRTRAGGCVRVDDVVAAQLLEPER